MRSYEKSGGGALLLSVVGDAHEFGDGQEAQPFASASFQNVRQRSNASRGVGDAIVQNDNRSGDEILFDQPADVPHWRMRRVMRVGAPEHAGITARLN